MGLDPEFDEIRSSDHSVFDREVERAPARDPRAGFSQIQMGVNIHAADPRIGTERSPNSEKLGITVIVPAADDDGSIRASRGFANEFGRGFVVLLDVRRIRREFELTMETLFQRGFVRRASAPAQKTLAKRTRSERGADATANVLYAEVIR